MFPFYRQEEFLHLLENAIRRCTAEHFTRILQPLLAQMEREYSGDEPGSTLLFELLFHQLLLHLLKFDFTDTDALPKNREDMDDENHLLDKAISFVQNSLADTPGQTSITKLL